MRSRRETQSSPRGVCQLHYAVKDVEDLKNILVKSYGFSPQNVTVLSDENATLDNIRHALSGLANSQSVKSDDRVLVYYCATLFREIDLQLQCSTIVEHWSPSRPTV